MGNFNFNSFRSALATIRNGGDMSPSFAWYAIISISIAMLSVGGIVAYDRYQWAVGEVQVKIPDQKEVNVSQADVERVISVYEKRKSEYQRLMQNGAVDIPVLTIEYPVNPADGVQFLSPGIPGGIQ